MDNEDKNKRLNLSRTQTILLVFFCVLLISGVDWIPRLFDVALDAAQIIALITGVIALGISAYTGMLTTKIKKFEIARGNEAAKSLVVSDAVEALIESQKLIKKLYLFDGDNKEAWNSHVKDLCGFERRYERRQDMLVFLSSQFAPSTFLEVQSMYLLIARLFRQGNDLFIPPTTQQADVSANISRRKNILCNEIKQLQIELLDKFEGFDFAKISEDLKNEIVTKNKDLAKI